MAPERTAERAVHVLHLLRWLHVTGGGIRTYLANLIRALEGSAVEVSAASFEPGSPPAYVRQVPYAGRRGDGALAKLCGFWKWVRVAVRRTDVVHIHDVFGWTFLAGSAACLLGGTPFVVSPHGALEPALLASKRRRKLLYLRVLALPILRRSAAVLVTTPRGERSLRALDASLPVRLVVPGVAADLPPAGGEPGGPLRIAYLGRFDAGKGIPTLIQAIAVLRNRGVEVTLDLVGAGAPAATAALQRLVSEAGVDDRIAFRGYLDGAAKWEVLRRMQVMAVPSASENFSFAAAEALALGMPVVVTTGVGLAEQIARADCGSVVPPHDPAALAAALAQYVDAGVRSARGARARQLARQELSLHAMGRELQALYRQVARQRGETGR